VLCEFRVWCGISDVRVVGDDREHVDDCKYIALYLTCVSEGEAA
jgi:hypothetical protein